MSYKFSLQGPVIEPNNKEKVNKIIVLLHGYGADGHDLISLAPYMGEDESNVWYIAPNAPEECELSPWGHQWFSLKDWSEPAMAEGARTTAPKLDVFLDELLDYHGLEEKDLALIGFSQGTMMSLQVALRRDKPVACVVGFSGRLCDSRHLEQEVKSKPPVCLIHGTADPVVPFEEMEKAEAGLKHVGVPVETHERPGLPHGIDAEGIDVAQAFLKKHLF